MFLRLLSAYRWLPALGALACLSASQPEQLPLLTTISSVRSLTGGEARRGYPVKVRGTVTFDLQQAWLFFIQDGQYGIFLMRDPDIASHFLIGDRVEVTGVSGPGSYSPLIVVRKIELLEHGSLPRPVKIEIPELLAARAEGRWVEVTGKIESAQTAQVHGILGTEILLDAAGHKVRVVVSGIDPASPDPQSLIDAEVSMQGVSSTTFNNKRQLTGVMLNVPGFEQVKILRPPAANPWETAEEKISDLLQFRSGGESGSRVRVRGQVTYFEPGQLLVIQHDGTGLIVQTAQRGKLGLGDLVEVLGKPVLGGYTPLLQDAVFRKTGNGLAPAPVKQTPEDLLSGDFDAELVLTEAELVGRQHGPKSTVLSFRSGQVQFTARLEGKDTNLALSRLENGSRVRLTGICRVAVYTRDVVPEGFSLQLRAQDDIHVLARPVWWTLPRLSMALFGMAMAIMLVFGWVWSLRRRVKQQILALATSEREFRNLFEGSPVGIYRASPDGDILLANPTLIRMLGYTDFEEFRSAGAKVRCDVDSRCSVWTHRSGAEMSMRENSRAVFGEGGGLIYNEGTVEDITDQIRAEQRNRDRKQILEMLARNEPFVDITSQIALAVERQFQGSFCCIMLRSGDVLTVGAAPNLPQALLEAMNQLQVGPVSGCCGSAVYWSRIITSGNMATDPLWHGLREAVLWSGLCGSCSIPIASGSGKVEGTLDVYWRQPHQASEAEIELLQSAANLTGVAIRHHDLYQQLAWRADHDALTGLANRRLFESRLEGGLAHARRTDSRMAVLWIDLDRFKQINDTFGHHTGDLFLQQVGLRLKSGLRAGDTLARMGGDEFAAVLEGVSGQDDARQIAEGLREGMRARFDLDGCELFGGASIGISMFPEDGADAEELQRNADVALYHAKRLGKGRMEFFTSEMVLAHTEGGR